MKSAWQIRQLLAVCSIISSSYLINIVCLLRTAAASEALKACTIFLLGTKLGEFCETEKSLIFILWAVLAVLGRMAILG